MNGTTASALLLGATFTTLGCSGSDERGASYTEDVGSVQAALTSGTYEIRAVNSNQCLDVAGVSLADGAPVQQWACTGGSNQRWNIVDLGSNQHELTAAHSGKALNVLGGNMPTGAKVVQWPYGGSAGNERWYIDWTGASFALKPVYDPSLCMDVLGNNSNQGNELAVWTCNNLNNQRFYVNRVYTSPSWHTDWVDNFDGTWLDRGRWTVVVGQDGNFNDEAQWYVDEEGVENNFWVSNGELKLKIQREDRNFGYVKNYTSARLTTKGKFTPANGAWEARLMFWAGNGADGAWPAFWLLGSNANQAPSPGSACWPTWGAREIDVFEFTMDEGKLNPSTIITNFIQGDSCGGYWGNSSNPSVNAYGYNTYRMEFWGGEAKIFVNGNFIRAVNDDPWQDQGYAAILNVAMGGTLGGPVSFPGGAYAGITVDYVKHEVWW